MSKPGSVSEFISRVLEKRVAQKPRLDKAQACLRNLSASLRSLLELSAATEKNPSASEEMRQKAGDLSGGLKDEVVVLSEVDAKVTNLMARFSKGTINIGVAGRARQGKSTFLQAVSGLADSVIPASSGPPVTGAKSRIHHRADDPHAVIDFYTREEFFREIVNAYYDELEALPRPGSLEEFAAQSLPEKAPSEIPSKIALYSKLKNLQASLKQFRDYLSSHPQRVGLEQVRDFVSQEGDRKKYLAVRCANIFTPFPSGDVTGLALVDLPGLGEMALGHSEKLVASLQREVDAVILVKMPAETGDFWQDVDYRVFSEIKRAIPELDIADWLFVILNRKQGGANNEIIQKLKSDPPNVGSKPAILDVTCIEPAAVRETVLMAVLRYLEVNLERIDLAQWKGLASSVLSVCQNLDNLTAPIAALLTRSTVDMEDRNKFAKNFKLFMQQLRMTLNKLVVEYGRGARQGGGTLNLGPAVDEACDTAKREAPIPSANQLEIEFVDKGGWPGVIQEQLHSLRAYLTETLATTIDRHLVELMTKVKGEITSGFLSDPIGNILRDEDAKGAKTPAEKLEVFRSLLDPKTMPNVVSGIDFLRVFSFSYQSHFHHRVRQAMNPLDPMGGGNSGSNGAIGSINPDGGSESAQEVHDGLRAFYDRVIYEVRGSLHAEMDKDPGKILFSLVEEVNDRLVRAKEVEEQWDQLLYPLRGEIWPEVYGKIQIASRQRKAWLSSLEALAQAKTGLVETLS